MGQPFLALVILTDALTYCKRDNSTRKRDRESAADILRECAAKILLVNPAE